MNAQNQSEELEGAAAVVTGSSRNIGRAIALALAEAGAAVLINAKTSADAAKAVAGEIEAAGGRAIAHLADVTEPQQVDGMVDAALKAFGRLDILVNNVAVRKESPVTETTFEDWRTILASVLDAAFLCTKATVPHLAAHGQGAIVNIGGVAGHAGVANRCHVAAAKAGLAGMTGSLAVELAPLGITVNCVAPGYVNTARGEGRLPAHFAERAVPLGRPAEPDEIAAMVRFLCGPGGRYISGETIHMNGAWYVTIA